MNRLKTIEIAGKNYPLSFSLGATKAIANRFGSLEKMTDTFDMENGVDEKTVDNILFVLELLIKQGCAYKNVFANDEPAEPDAPVKDGKFVALEREELEVALGLMDLREVMNAIYGAVGLSQEREIEVEEKNAETPKGNCNM